MEQNQLDSDDWLQLVAKLGGEAALAASAREHGAFLRARRLKSAVDLLRMALMYGPGGQSLRSLAAMAAAQGVADLSDVSLMERLRNAADWLEALCAENLGRVAQTIGIKASKRPIRIVDGSRIEGPGNRAWRLHLCYDPNLARITDAAITTLKEGERLDRLAVTPGEIRLGDRGYPHPDAIKSTLEAGADDLLRLTWNSLQLRHTDDQPLDWTKLFSQADAQGSFDLAVRVHKARSQEKPCEMRLVERLTRVNADTIKYEGTVVDQTMFRVPWTLSLLLEREERYRLYEYACHEGNYSMDVRLSGARADGEDEAGKKIEKR